jgi:hypothetical protein
MHILYTAVALFQEHLLQNTALLYSAKTEIIIYSNIDCLQRFKTSKKTDKLQ